MNLKMSKSNWNYPTTMWVGENRIKDLNLACKVLEIKKPLLVTAVSYTHLTLPTKRIV